MTKRSLNWIAGFLLFCSGAWLAHVKAVGPIPWNEYPSISKAVTPLYTHHFAIYFVLLLASGLTKGWALFREAGTKKAHVQKLLDGLVGEVMKTPSTFGAQDYRVTLYEYQRICFRAWLQSWRNDRARGLLKGWLVPYARSGGEGWSKKTYFDAPKTSKQGQIKGHGITGTAWIKGEATASNLPSVTAVSGPTLRRRYCEGACIDDSELQRRLNEGKSLAPALWAERLSTKHRPKWGVLVYDSIDPQPIIDDSNMAGHRLGLLALALVLEENIV